MCFLRSRTPSPLHTHLKCHQQSILYLEPNLFRHQIILRAEIINDPAQKILPGQDLAPGRMPGRVLFTLSNLANRPALLERTRAQQEFLIRSKWPQDSTQSNRTLSTFSHHPAWLILGDCGRRDPVFLSLHARDLVPAVRERIRKKYLRVYDSSRACF